MNRNDGWEETRSGLSFVFWGWLAMTLAPAFSGLFSVWWFQSMSPAFEDLHASLRGYQIASLFFSACKLAGIAVCIVGMTRVFRAPVDARLNGLVAGALCCLAALALVELFSVLLAAPTISSHGGGMSWRVLGIGRVVALTRNALHAGAAILTVLMLYSIAKRVQALLPFWFGVIVAAVVGFDTLLSAYQLYAGARFNMARSNPWGWMFFTAAAWTTESVLFLMLVSKTRHTLVVGAGGASAERDWEGAAGWFGSDEWRAPTRGIGLYAGGLKAVLLVVLCGYGTIVLAWALGLGGLAAITAVAIPLGLFIAQIVMLVGLVGFASVPLKSGARGFATGALVAHGLGLLLDILSTVAILMVLLHRSDYLDEVRRQLARAQIFGGLAQAVALTSCVLAVSSLARVSRFIGAAELTSKAMPVVAMMIVTAGAVVLMRLVMASARVVENAGTGLLALALGVVFLALTSLLMYLSFVNKVHAVLVEGPPEVPPAPLV